MPQFRTNQFLHHNQQEGKQCRANSKTPPLKRDGIFIRFAMALSETLSCSPKTGENLNGDGTAPLLQENTKSATRRIDTTRIDWYPSAPPKVARSEPVTNIPPVGEQKPPSTFTVICDDCGSSNVTVQLIGEIYWDDGAWFVCGECGSRAVIEA